MGCILFKKGSFGNYTKKPKRVITIILQLQYNKYTKQNLVSEMFPYHFFPISESFVLAQGIN